MDVRRYTHFFGDLFLLFLLIQSISIILNTYNIKGLLPQNLDIYWAMGAGIFGSLFVWGNKLYIPKIDYIIYNTERKKNKLHERRFKQKYPTLSNIPVLGFLYRKWKNEPFFYKLTLVGLCFLGGMVYLYDLAYYDWLPDEPLVIRAAKGYLETGTYTSWDFWNNQIGNRYYDRAWPHTLIISQVIKIFGISEWTMRIVSVFFGVLFIIMIYGVSNFFLQNRLAATVVTFMCIMHPYFIVYFRRVRMYALLIPAFLLLFYLFYRILTTKKKYPIAFYQNNKWVQKYFNYDWTLIIGTLIVLFIAIEVHKLTFGLIAMGIPLFLYLLFVKKQSRLLPLFIAGLFGSVLVKYSAIGGTISRTFTFFEMNQVIYLDFLFGFPYPEFFTTALLLIGLLLLWLGKFQTRWIALYSVIIVASVLYIWIIKYPAHFRYILHVIPISYILIIGILLKINSLFIPKWKKFIIPITILILSTMNFVDNYQWIYYKQPEVQFSSQAYTSIKKYIKSEKEGIVSLFFEGIYMQGMGKKVEMVNIPRGRVYRIEQFEEDKKPFEAVWVVWATHKSYHIRTDFIKYVGQNCRKYHGYGIDNTLTEVYYCQ